MKDQIEPFYRARAKEIVDLLFDKGYFREDVSRDGMNDVEEVLAWTFQSQCSGAVKMALLTKKIKGGDR